MADRWASKPRHRTPVSARDGTRTLPPYFGDDLMLFHWSPTERRKSIERYGLKPGCLSIDRLWRPPYVAFADTPSLAFSLSIQYKRDVESWDLWMVWRSTLKGFEQLADDRDGSCKEYRVYERVYKRDVWWVGTRQTPSRALSRT